MTPAELLAQIDVLATHVNRSIERLDHRAEEIATQRIELALTQRTLNALRAEAQTLDRRVYAVKPRRRLVTTFRRDVRSSALVAVGEPA